MIEVQPWQLQKALNSYAHAGILPICRHDGGYREQLLQTSCERKRPLACRRSFFLGHNRYSATYWPWPPNARPVCMPEPL